LETRISNLKLVSGNLSVLSFAVRKLGGNITLRFILKRKLKRNNFQRNIFFPQTVHIVR